MNSNVLLNVMSVENDIQNIHTDFLGVPTYSEEGLGDFVAGINGIFSNKLNFLTGFISGEKTKFPTEELSDYGRQLKLNAVKVDGILRNKPVTMVLDTDVIVPMGFNADLLYTAKELDKAISLIKNTLFVEIDKVDTLISNILTDEGYRLSSRPLIKNNNAKEINKTLNKILKDIVGVGSTEEIVKLRTILPSVNKLKDVNNILLAISSGVHLDTLNQIKSASQRLREKCEELHALSKNNSNFKIRKEILISLVEDLEATALMITNASTILTYYAQLVNCFLVMCEKINNA